MIPRKRYFPDTIGLVSNEHTEIVTICTKYAKVQTKVLAQTRGYGQKYHHNSKSYLQVIVFGRRKINFLQQSNTV